MPDSELIVDLNELNLLIFLAWALLIRDCRLQTQNNPEWSQPHCCYCDGGQVADLLAREGTFPDVLFIV